MGSGAFGYGRRRLLHRRIRLCALAVYTLMLDFCLLFLGSLGAPEIIIIALIVLLLFGGKKIPELMSGLGKGVKKFKDGVNGIEKDITDGIDTDTNGK